MILRPCNLNCQGCTTFSDLRWSGYQTWEQGREQITPWLSRLQFQAWGVMGGEPLMNPDLENWIRGIRSLMPDTQIRFVTNGLLLDRNRWIVDLLHDLGNTVLKISYHISDPQLDQEVQRIKDRFLWQPVSEFGIDRWITGRDFRFQISRPQKFIKTFRGTYQDMLPHASDPGEAFANCVQKRCPMIHEGLLYKCGTAALTPGILKRFHSTNLEAWIPYIGTGLSPDCNEEQLDRFLENFARPHEICRQCPTKSDQESMIDHARTVSRK